MTGLRDLVIKLMVNSSGLVKGFDDAERKVGSFGGRLESSSASARTAGLAMTAGLTGPLVGVGVSALKTAADFEGGMNMLQAVTRASAEDMKRLGDRAVELGADLSLPKTSAVDAGKAMLELSKAGLSVDHVMTATKGVLQLAAAANIDEARSAEIAATALNAFNLPGERAMHVADLLANASAAASGEITDMAAALQMSAAVFGAFQGPVVGAEQALDGLVGVIGDLATAGIIGSDAGTSLKQSMLQLTGPSNVAKGMMQAVNLSAIALAHGMDLSGAAMEQAIGGATQKERNAGLAKLTEELQRAGIATEAEGTLAYDAAGKMRAYKDIIGLTQQGTAGLTDALRNQAITTIFGADATRAVTILMQKMTVAEGETSSASDKMAAAVTKAGGAAELSGARMKGLNGAIDALSSQIETLLLQQGTPFMDFFTGLIGHLSSAVTWFGNLPGPVQQAALAIGLVLAVVGPLLLILPMVVAGFGAIATVVGAVAAAVGAVGVPVLVVVGALVALGAAIAVVVAKRDDIGAFFDSTGEKVQGFIELIRGLKNELGGGLASALSGLGSAMSKVGSGLNSLISGWLGNLGKWLGLADRAGKLGISLPSLPNLPGFAAGVTNFGGGLAVVGERGPEVVALPRGANVYPAAGRAAPAGAGPPYAMAGGGLQVVFAGPVYGFSDFEDRVVQALDRADRRGRR